MNTGIYQITNLQNGKCYVGSAASFTKRWKEHVRQLSNGNHHSTVMQRAWNKYGEAAFEFKKLLVCAKADLIWYEQRAIDVLKPAYNICKVAGSVLGYRHTDEAKTAAAERARGNTNRRGRKELQEVCDRISAGRKGKGIGRVFDAETREKIAAAQRGRTLTEEQKEHLRKINTGKKQSPETIEKRMQKLRGRTRSAEANEKTAAWHRGRKHPESAILAMSLAKGSLTADQVREIRRRILEGEKQASLAREFGVQASTISDIHRRKKYKLVI